MLSPHYRIGFGAYPSVKTGGNLSLHRDGLLQSLSPRERQVLSLLGACYSHRAIAKKLGLHEGTVRNLAYKINKRLGICPNEDFDRAALRIRAADRLLELEKNLA